MEIEKQIERYRNLANRWENGEQLLLDGAMRIQDELRDAATVLSTLQAENERLRAAADNWKKKYVDANGKWIEAENKWAGLDKAVRNGSVYRPMQEELNLTHEENQSLKDVNEKLRAELERVKAERDTAVEDMLDAAITPCSYCAGNPINGGICDMDNETHEMYSCWKWRGKED